MSSLGVPGAEGSVPGAELGAPGWVASGPPEGLGLCPEQIMVGGAPLENSQRHWQPLGLVLGTVG